MERIVVGIADSPAGAAALRWSLSEAATHGWLVTAVRGWLPPAFTSPFPFRAELSDWEPVLPDAARTLVEEQLAAAREDVPTASQVVVTVLPTIAAAPQALLEQAEGAALLVVGRRSSALLERMVLGSVSAAVLHHAVCPVVIVPADSEPCSRVVVGVDGSAPSKAALRFAITEARTRAVPLVPVHAQALQIGLENGMYLSDPATLRSEMLAELEKAVTDAGGGDLDVAPEMGFGSPSSVLLGMTHPSDLLVLGSRGRGGFAGLVLGSTSAQCSAHAKCPVAVIREEYKT